MPRPRRPKVLLITPIVPLPLDQGPRETLHSLLGSLDGRFDVTVLTLTSSSSEQEHARELEQHCDRVIPVVAPVAKSTFHRLVYRAFYRIKSTVLRRSLKQIYDCPGALIQAAGVLSSENFDAIVVAYWQLYRVMKLFPAERTVLLTFDIDMLMNHQISLLERQLIKKIQAVRKWLMERPEEIAAYRSASHIWTLTEQDKGVVEKICRDRCPVHVLPFSIDEDFFAPSGMNRDHGEVLFAGWFDDPSNRDALEFFVRKVYPHIDDIPGLSITIIGGNLPEEIGSFGLLPEVEVMGPVPDVRPYLHRASCMVAPQRFGSGLRISVLEAAAAELPLVASKVAMNGLPFVKEEDFLLASEPEEYAQRIREVLSDGVAAARMARSAASRVRNEFGARVQNERVVALVESVMRRDDAT